MFFPSLNQHYDIIICVYWFKLISQVSDVAHGPLVYVTCCIYLYSKRAKKNDICCTLVYLKFSKLVHVDFSLYIYRIIASRHSSIFKGRLGFFIRYTLCILVKNFWFASLRTQAYNHFSLTHTHVCSRVRAYSTVYHCPHMYW